jgi:hypothetical protein
MWKAWESAKKTGGNIASSAKKGVSDVANKTVQVTKTVVTKTADVGKVVAKTTGEGINNVAKHTSEGVGDLSKGVLKVVGLNKKEMCKEEKIGSEEYYDPKKKALSICSLNSDEERNAMWNIIYYDDWEKFPVKFMNDMLSEIIIKANEKYDKMFNDPEGFFKEEKEGKKILASGLEKIGKEGLKAAIKRTAGTECVKIAVGAGGKHGASKAAGLIAGKTAGIMIGSTALKVMGHPAVGIGAFVGEQAGYYAAEKLGVEDKRFATYMGLAGGLLAGIAVGACVGGPFGAAAGAGVAVGGWAISQTAGALSRCQKGPSDNWAYVDTGMVDGTICVGTWGADDGVYGHTYAKENYKCYRNQVVSAGQAKKDPFQVTIWDDTDSFAKKMLHINVVNYRDHIFICKLNGKHIIVHCRGEFSDKPGTTTKHIC